MSLFLRNGEHLPPPGLDVRDNFFSLQREPTEKDPGRIVPRASVPPVVA